MKLNLYVAFLCICIFTGLALRGQHMPDAAQVILKLKAPSGRSIAGTGIARINSTFGAVRVHRQVLVKEREDYIYVIRFPGGTDLTQVIEAYYKTGEAEYAEPDHPGEGGGIIIPNDPQYSRQWACKNNETFPNSKLGADIKMEEAWEIEKGDSSIVVTIIDSGTKLDHPEFAGRIWTNTGEIPGNGKDDDMNGYIDDVNGWDFANSDNTPADDHGHGTNVSGIIGANANNGIGYAGIDWNCKLMILKGLDQNNLGYFSWWASAIYYAVAKGAKVINMSLGGTANSVTLQTAINHALNNNVTVVACMMNTNSGTLYYPAAYPGVIAVGSTDPNDKRSSPFFWGTTSGSNYGSHISVVAPGNFIYGLSHQSNTNFDTYWGGTSQATPIVSGLAALLLAQDNTRNPSMIKYIIETSAQDKVGNPDEDVPGRDNYYGAGRVNALKALSLCRPLQSPGTVTGATNVCPGQSSVIYSVPGLPYANSYLWSLPNGVTGVSTGSSITVNFTASAASGQISVRGVNPCGSGPASSISFNVQALPNTAGTVTGDNNICQGQKNVTYFVPQIANANSYVWTLPGGKVTSTATNMITFNYDSASASGNVTVMGKNSCGTGPSSFMSVTVHTAPAAAGSISGSAEVCNSQQGITYTIPQVANATSYEWTLPAGASGTSTTNSITVNYASAASGGEITVRGKNACGNGAASVLPIHVYEAPAAAATISGSISVCQGAQEITYSVPEIANATSYVWTLPAGAAGTGTNNSITVSFDNDAASGAIMVKGKNTCGTGSSSALDITVDPLPVPAGKISGIATVCAGQKQVTYTIPQIDHAASYEWTLPEGATGTSDSGSITISYEPDAVSGKIFVKGKNDCGYGTAAALNITVNPKPATPVVTFSNKMLRSDAVAGNQWYNKFGLINGATEQEYAAEFNGIHYSIVTLSGCSSDTSNKIQVVHTGLNDAGKGLAASIYPNPVRSELFIETGDARNTTATAEIINSVGQVVYRTGISGKTMIPAENITPGMYTLKLENEKAVQYFRFVKE